MFRRLVPGFEGCRVKALGLRVLGFRGLELWEVEAFWFHGPCPSTNLICGA